MTDSKQAEAISAESGEESGLLDDAEAADMAREEELAGQRVKRAQIELEAAIDHANELGLRVQVEVTGEHMSGSLLTLDATAVCCDTFLPLPRER
ncbi:MAG: hypothetical protein GY722_27440 [bacterium]|nr:hypothetical protein [bacterium]